MQASQEAGAVAVRQLATNNTSDCENSAKLAWEGGHEQTHP